MVLKTFTYTKPNNVCFANNREFWKKGCRNTADKTQFTLQTNKTSECWKPWQEGSKSNAANYSLWVETYIFWKSSSQNAHPLTKPPVTLCLKCESRFQPGEGPSRGPLRDYEPSDGFFWSTTSNITMNLTSGLPSTSSSWWGWSYRSCCPAAPAATPGCSSASWSPSSSPRWRDLPCLSTRTWASASGSGKYECEYTKGKMDVKWKSIHLLETPSLLLSLYHNITNERSLPVVYSANTITITPARANTH